MTASVHDDGRFDESTFIHSRTGIIMTTITGSISFLSSFAVASFIVRARVYNVYHRILILFSFFDMLTSLSIALTTIPMPRDVIISYSGPSYGTVGTCEVQAFIYLAGTAMSLCMNVILNVYYFCTLTCNMQNGTFRTFVEPILCCVTLLSTSLCMLVVTKADILNPSDIEPFCSVAVYPAGCDKEEDPECRGTPKDMDIFYDMFNIYIMISGATLIITMGLIIRTFYKRQKELKEEESQSHDNEVSDGIPNEFQRAKFNMKMICRQAFLYFAAFWLTWGTSIVAVSTETHHVQWIQVLRMLCQPSQGLFNMLIFFYHKVSYLCRIDAERSIQDAIKIMFLNPRQAVGIQEVFNIDISLVLERIDDAQESSSIEMVPTAQQSQSYSAISRSTPSINLSDALSSAGGNRYTNEEEPNTRKYYQVDQLKKEENVNLFTPTSLIRLDDIASSLDIIEEEE